MGRFGNVMLVNGETAYHLEAQQGEIVRFYLTNTANTRIFNIRMPGAQMKLVGSDSGRYEHEAFVDEVSALALGTSSRRRAVRPGRSVGVEHHTPEHTYVLGEVTVGTQQAEPSFAGEFATLRTSEELSAERTRLAEDFDRPADKTLALVGEMAGMGQQEDEHQDDEHASPALEWEDTMNAMNRRSSPKNMFWKLIDRETGAENHAIDWRFRIGDRVQAADRKRAEL